MKKILKEWTNWAGIQNRLVAYDNGRIDYIVRESLVYDNEWRVEEEFSSINSVDMILHLIKIGN